ncbi:glycosyltransferase [Proteiniclasticum sp.]|uniref:glycosyltransferase n=1 Tax=Proteiniclasticum sp. TaxID=2053595 RepID=UPI0028A0DEF8|nr:glycosyltransferase [Proteiniclasticum sp.]
MNIFYVSSLCSDSKFKELFEVSEKKPQQQAQKFHSLLSQGLLNSNNSIHFLSRPPVNKTTSRKINISGVEEKFGNATYQYLKISENLILKHISLFFSGLISATKWKFNNREEKKIIICDILNLSISISALLSSKIWGIKSVAIITDLPNYMNYTKQTKLIESISWKLYRCICNFFLQRYDYYIILTEQMNELVNSNAKPYIVIEGLVDMKMKTVPNQLNNKYKEKIIIYAGALYEKYGIKSLIEAFIRLEDPDSRLWLFGDGDMVDEILDYEKRDHRIKFFGVVSNEKIVQEQLKATLLVNPRPSKEDFTKYSFPSKNMEYMVSGTPILTTALQGMPKEYIDYVYLLEDETIEGMTKTLKKILQIEKEQLHEKGLKAKEFVLKEKNYVVQATQIIDMLSSN